MAKATLFILLNLFYFNSFSQEIESIYKFKKENVKRQLFSKSKWNYYELDSLILYKNKQFKRFLFYNYHSINNSELKGKWSTENNFIILDIEYLKEDNTWIKNHSRNTYIIKRKKLIPIEEENYLFPARKLKKQ